jgi:hypothetical protein
MPSGARLMSGSMLALAMIGAIYLAAWHDPSIGVGARDRLFVPGGVIGFFFGWWMLGRKLGRGFARTLGWSISTMAVTGFWFFAFLAARSTTVSVLAGQHRGRPVQALEAMVEQLFIFAQYAADVRVLLAAMVGALIAGAMGEYARMIWN